MICCSVALPAEAKPLIHHYRLHAQAIKSPFKVYQNDAMTLIVSGVGKTAASDGVKHLQSLLAEQHPHIAWLNIGIAGHKDANIGQGFLAHKITDQLSQQSWYPPCYRIAEIETHSITTVAQAESTYSTMDIYDMEASGFYPTASTFSSGEIIKCYKVISDNQHSPVEQINAKWVARLINEQIPVIDQIIASLRETLHQLNRIYSTPRLYFELIERYRFTQTQRHQLKQLLRHWFLLAPDPLIFEHKLAPLSDARKIIAKLTQLLQELPVGSNSPKV